MGFVLCPRCELNYMSDKDTYCTICMQELHGTSPVDEVELCSICNENPVIPGKDVCPSCLRELENRGKDTSTEDGDERDSADRLGELDSMANVDEMMPLDADDDRSYGDMEHALSLESVREDEENEEDEEEIDS